MDNFIKNLARGAGGILREGFRTKFKINHKSGHWDPVTKYDLASEDFLIEKIRSKYPRHGILAEESGYTTKNKKNLWIIDPLDGTRAFSRGLAQFCVCIAFVSQNKIKYGVVYDPIEDELFFAQNKKGATLNNRAITIYPTEDLDYSIVPIMWGGDESDSKQKETLYRRVTKYRFWTLKLGSMGLSAAYAACGRFDAVIANNQTPWDLSAAALILAESGARITDFKGKPYHWKSTQIVAAGPVLHKQLIGLVNDL